MAKAEEGCLFCRIVNREVPSEIIWEDDEEIAIRDIRPQAPVHILLIPKRHIPGITQLSEEDKSLIGHIHVVATKFARDQSVFQCGSRLVANSGPDAGQAINHLHFHFLGGRKLGWPPG